MYIEKKRKAYRRRRRHTAVYLKKKKNSTKAVRTVDCIRWLFADESVLVVVVEYCANQLLYDDIRRESIQKLLAFPYREHML